jgi:magnesium-transporting ATPase (P-type)
MILTPWMWRQILGQSIYQILVMTFLMYFGGLVFFTESFNLVHAPAEQKGPTGEIENQGTIATWKLNRMQLDTICFHSFILMNLFNSINCRLVDTKELTQLNIFRTLFNNFTFWIVFLLEMGIQDVMIRAGQWGLGSAIVGTTSLTQGMTITCWAFGVFSLVVNLIIKQIPIDYFEFTSKINLETENEGQAINKYMKMGKDQFEKRVSYIQEASQN